MNEINAEFEREARVPTFWRSCAILVAVFATLIVGSCVHYRWSEPRGHLPAGIEIAEVERWHSDGLFMEACAYGRYKLDHASKVRLRQGGLRIIRQAGPPVKYADRYREWQTTPLIIERDREANPSLKPTMTDDVLALSATSCGVGWRDGFTEARLQRGSFYALTSNLEGLVLIDPKQGKAWFLYYG